VSRFPIAMTAVTLGALAVSTAVVIGAFEVIDKRAAQVLKSEPRAVPAAKNRAPSADASRTSRRESQAARGSPASGTGAATVGSAASAAGVAAPQAPQQIIPGHHRTRHARRYARRHSQEPPSPEPALQQPPSPAPQDSGRSAVFFPSH
jgi:hypothetical protein